MNVPHDTRLAAMTQVHPSCPDTGLYMFSLQLCRTAGPSIAELLTLASATNAGLRVLKKQLTFAPHVPKKQLSELSVFTPI